MKLTQCVPHENALSKQFLSEKVVRVKLETIRHGSAPGVSDISRFTEHDFVFNRDLVDNKKHKRMKSLYPILFIIKMQTI